MVVALILRNNHSNISSLFPSDAPSDSRLSLSSLVAGHDFQDGTGEKKCSLLGPVGLIVQASMGVLVVLSLVIKRQFEGGKGKAKRKWKIWGMDVGKQLIGQGFVHFLNVGVSARSGIQAQAPYRLTGQWRYRSRMGWRIMERIRVACIF